LTGATLNELALLLRKAGVEHIQVWGLAKRKERFITVKGEKKRTRSIILDNLTQVFTFFRIVYAKNYDFRCGSSAFSPFA
ncbi:ComF, partial [Pasteurella multocida subsp. multocida str. Anand1_cattle]